MQPRPAVFRSQDIEPDGDKMHAATIFRQRLPQLGRAIRHDHPITSIRRRAGPVCGRWFGMAPRVGMIVADDSASPCPRLPMRGDQDRRIDFKMLCRIGRDIRRRLDVPYPSCFAQQKAANLVLLSLCQRDDATQQKT